MKSKLTAATLAVAALLLQVGCEWGQNESPAATSDETASPVATDSSEPPAATAETPAPPPPLRQTPVTPPAAPPIAHAGEAHRDVAADVASSVTVYIKLLIKKDYGLLATIAGKRDSTQRSLPYDIENEWWDNPLVAYRDPALPVVDVTGGADAEPIGGKGSSKNVEIELALVPHADVAIHTVPASDAMKATITLNLVAVASYYDGAWTPMLKTSEKRVTFTIDTREAGRKVQAIATDVRTIPVLSVERYIRDKQKWEPKSAWPTTPQSGDWHTDIHGTDVKLEVTGYRYVH